MTSLQEEDIRKLDECRALSLLEECKETIHRLNDEIAAQYHQQCLLEERILALRSPKSPLNRIPDELMLDIFDKVKRHDSLALGPILGVCRKWYQLAIDSPFLWANIKLDLEHVSDAAFIKRSQQYLEAAIRNSKQAPLSVDIALPNLHPLIRQISLNILEVSTWDLAEDENEDRYHRVYDWMEELLSDSSDPRAFVLCNDIEDSVSEFMAAVAGSNGANLLRLRLFDLYYDQYRFNHWLFNGVFHHPTPILEEMSMTIRDNDSSSLSEPIFVYPAPRLARITAAPNYPFDELLNTNSVVNSLYLDFHSMTFDTFPNHASLKNLKYLCINSLPPRQDSINTILLPSLEDLTFRGTYIPNYIEAPRLTTFRFLVYQKVTSDPTYIPYFPLLRKFHWILHSEEDGKFEPLQQYLDQHPLVEEIGVVSLDEKLMKDMLPRLKDALGGRKIAIKRYGTGPGWSKSWSWSAPFPYESHEIDMY